MKETKNNLFGEALEPKELKKLIIKSRKSGTVSLDKAHEQVRKKQIILNRASISNRNIVENKVVFQIKLEKQSNSW